MKDVTERVNERERATFRKGRRSESFTTDRAAARHPYAARVHRALTAEGRTKTGGSTPPRDGRWIFPLQFFLLRKQVDFVPDVQRGPAATPNSARILFTASSNSW